MSNNHSGSQHVTENMRTKV